MLDDQCKDPLCPQLLPAIELPGSHYSHYHNGFQVRIATIGGVLQKVDPQSLKVRLPHAYPYPPLGGHPTERSRPTEVLCN